MANYLLKKPHGNPCVSVKLTQEQWGVGGGRKKLEPSALPTSTWWAMLKTSAKHLQLTNTNKNNNINTAITLLTARDCISRDFCESDDLAWAKRDTMTLVNTRCLYLREDAGHSLQLYREYRKPTEDTTPGNGRPYDCAHNMEIIGQHVCLTTHSTTEDEAITCESRHDVLLPNIMRVLICAQSRRDTGELEKITEIEAINAKEITALAEMTYKEAVWKQFGYVYKEKCKHFEHIRDNLDEYWHKATEKIRGAQMAENFGIGTLKNLARPSTMLATQGSVVRSSPTPINISSTRK
ncbi:hypothetical protein PR048_012906 [Dryococelus australis]|uniref:Uncharacterized protein n=1 Tax=Dryococelus australis TaxID=614101 RepID=A0ABQ9HQP0_9NEOP|nr:hypothetical protein PR048_012906 [Dryococelus australis]